VSPRGTHLPAPPPYAIGSTGDRSRDATAAGEEAWLLLLREVCHTGAHYVPLIMRGCIEGSCGPDSFGRLRAGSQFPTQAKRRLERDTRRYERTLGGHRLHGVCVIMTIHK